MALFESYERRIDKITAVLNSYGIASLEEAEKITKDAGLEIYDQVKKIHNVFNARAASGATFDQLTHQTLMVSLLAEPVEHHQRTGRAAGIFSCLLIGFKMRQDMPCIIAFHVVVVVKDIIPGISMIRFSQKRSCSVLAELCSVLRRIWHCVQRGKFVFLRRFRCFICAVLLICIVHHRSNLFMKRHMQIYIQSYCIIQKEVQQKCNRNGKNPDTGELPVSGFLTHNNGSRAVVISAHVYCVIYSPR